MHSRGEFSPGIRAFKKDLGHFKLCSDVPLQEVARHEDQCQEDKDEIDSCDGSRRTRDAFERYCASLRFASVASRRSLSAPLFEQGFPHRRSAFPYDGGADRQTPHASDGFHHMLESEPRLHKDLPGARKHIDGLRACAHGGKRQP